MKIMHYTINRKGSTNSASVIIMRFIDFLNIYPTETVGKAKGTGKEFPGI